MTMCSHMYAELRTTGAPTFGFLSLSRRVAEGAIEALIEPANPEENMLFVSRTDEGGTPGKWTIETGMGQWKLGKEIDWLSTAPSHRMPEQWTNGKSSAKLGRLRIDLAKLQNGFIGRTSKQEDLPSHLTCRRLGPTR